MRKAGLWLIAAITVAAGAYWISASARSEVIQPINFSHEKHLTAKKKANPITCQTCHNFYKTRMVSGRPRLAICASCHSTTKPTSPEMRKLRSFIDNKQEIPWKRVYRIPKTVFYSHRTHVVNANLSCETCHGDIGAQKEALTRPLKPITMDTCIDCHRSTKVKSGASTMNGGKETDTHFVTTDCNACHK